MTCLTLRALGTVWSACSWSPPQLDGTVCWVPLWTHHQTVTQTLRTLERRSEGTVAVLPWVWSSSPPTSSCPSWWWSTCTLLLSWKTSTWPQRRAVILSVRMTSRCSMKHGSGSTLMPRSSYSTGESSLHQKNLNLVWCVEKQTWFRILLSSTVSCQIFATHYRIRWGFLNPTPSNWSTWTSLWFLEIKSIAWTSCWRSLHRYRCCALCCQCTILLWFDVTCLCAGAGWVRSDRCSQSQHGGEIHGQQSLQGWQHAL